MGAGLGAPSSLIPGLSLRVDSPLKQGGSGEGLHCRRLRKIIQELARTCRALGGKGAIQHGLDGMGCVNTPVCGVDSATVLSRCVAGRPHTGTFLVQEAWGSLQPRA